MEVTGHEIRADIYDPKGRDFKMKKKKIWYGFCIYLLCFYILQPARRILAATQVYTEKQFIQVMGRAGKESVELCADLPIDSPVTIRGDKEIHGRGHRLVRSKKGGRIYGGSLFVVRGGSCTWKDVTISGGGKSKELSGKVFGRLIEVCQGNLILGKGCVLRDNINDALAVDGGGAILVKSGGVCRMEDGVISGNRNMSKGAGVVVEKGGRFIMTGGEIKDNTAAGSGVVEGFDGRGGAIYSDGTVVIRGGLVQGNAARAYKKGKMYYGGAGAALYAAPGSVIQIEGGAFRDNWDDQGCPIWFSGQVSLGGEPSLQRIYLEKGSVIRSKKSFHPKGKAVIQPAVYASGICIAKGGEAPFKLASKKGYSLKKKGNGYYIRKSIPAKRESPPKEERQSDGQEKKRPLKRTSEKKNEKRSKQKKRMAPVIHKSESEFIFYVGEKVEKEILLHGMRATDQKEGDITEKLQVISPKHIVTDRVRAGTILYEVENQDGVRTRKKGHYRIKENHSPTIHTVPRFFFLREVAGYTTQQWRGLLLEECKLQDDCENVSDLQETTTVELGKLADARAGNYEVTVKVRDQFGHRFYMKQGEKRRYGEGREVIAKISVTLVDTSGVEGEDESGIRFLEPDSDDTVEEEWVFTSEDIQKIQDFMDASEDPFAAETNRMFLEAYGKCRNYEEDTGHE